MSSLEVSRDYLAQFVAYSKLLSSKALELYGLYPRTAVTGSIIALLFPWAVRNFQQYKALGRSGMPNPFIGWILATLLKPLGRETLSTEEYVRDPCGDSWLSAGDGDGGIPMRNRPRPIKGWHFAPHRQLDQTPPSEEVKASIMSEFRAIVDANTDIIQVQTSPHERLGEAMMIHTKITSPHRVAEAAWREIAHVHEQKDFSMHVTLAPQDCKLVIERGWGERHPLSGRLSLPKENLLIYAPQTEDDVRVAGLIMRASVGFMTGNKNVH